MLWCVCVCVYSEFDEIKQTFKDTSCMIKVEIAEKMCDKEEKKKT